MLNLHMLAHDLQHVKKAATINHQYVLSLLQMLYMPKE